MYWNIALFGILERIKSYAITYIFILWCRKLGRISGVLVEVFRSLSRMQPSALGHGCVEDAGHDVLDVFGGVHLSDVLGVVEIAQVCFGLGYEGGSELDAFFRVDELSDARGYLNEHHVVPDNP
jgi:hypothetical protein